MGFISDFFSGESVIPNPGGDYINSAKNAATISAGQSREAAENAEALNRERYDESLGRLDPYMERELAASDQLQIEMGLAPGEAGTAYMNTPGYKSTMSEALKGARQTSALAGSPYGGRAMASAGKAGAGVQSQYYNNYMNMLSGMASPSVTQNISSLGMGQAATIGNQNIGAASAGGQFRMQGAQQQQQATGDVLGAVASLFI